VRFVVTLRDGRAAGTETEALIDADPDAALLLLVPQLLVALDDDTDPAMAERVAIWVDGAPVDAGRHTLRTARVRPGSIVELHAHEEQPALAPSGVAELRVVNGPGAGRVHRLGLGRTVVGHDAPGLSLPDPELAADALTVVARPGGRVEVEPAVGTDARIDAVPLTGPTPWPLGGYLTAGDSVLELTPVGEADADSQENPDELGLDLVRHQRSTRPRPAPHFVLPARPPPTRTGAGREHRRQLAQWRDDRAVARAEVTETLARETRERREATPDPAAALLAAVGPGRRLWERLPLDDDWLQLRLGLAAQPPRTVIEDLDAVAAGNRSRRNSGPPDPLPSLLADVPVTLNLQAVGLLGIIGQASTAHATARWLVAQCATFHAPRELRITVLTAHDYAARRRWEWVSRLPHARPDEASGVTVLIGNDRESVEQRLSELGELITERSRPRRPGDGPVPSSPEVVVVLDGVQRLSATAGVSALMARGPAAGVHVICLDADTAALPEECRAVVTCTPGRIAFRRAQSPILDGIRPDLVEPAWADRLSRALAPVRLAGGPPVVTDPATAGDPRVWPIAWDDVGYAAPVRPAGG
jgi:DNA segregation ATPase FtsK/SpoIIIE, S-DNA-T family